MTSSNPNRLSISDAGLIHIAARSGAENDEVVRSRTTNDASPRYETPPANLLVRQAAQRGHTDLGWLSSFHSFSFGGYYDQNHMGFRSLRVINDDRIAPGHGFPRHPHRDMEIISYVLDGELQHRDSTGRGSVISTDDIQMMSAGTGIYHSEYNPSSESPNHFLQIWIEPSLQGVQPRYRENVVRADDKTNRWNLIAGPDDSGAAVGIHQDARINATLLQKGETLTYDVRRGRHAWLQVARGEVTVNGTTLKDGDAVATSRIDELHITSQTNSDLLLFDLA